MKTFAISQTQMEQRVARFQALKPLAIQQGDVVPQAARDVVYARKLLSVIGLEGTAKTPINSAAPIIGAGGMTMTLAICPPGQGPGLHSHRETYETFTVLGGKFEVTWNDNGENRLELDVFDTISIPPGVCRSFRNIGTVEGILQVLITGGVHDMNDIAFSANAAAKIESSAPGALEHFKEAGFRFDAGQEA